MAGGQQDAAAILDVDRTTSTEYTRVTGTTQSTPTSSGPESRADTPQRQLAFWNVNVPPSQHTRECPVYLRYALENAKDQGILSTPDALYRRQSWEDVCSFVKNNRLDLFQRVPSELRLYREFCHQLVERYGSVMEFVMKERLGWTNLVPSGPPFSNPDDYTILYNDWPYGIDTRCVHLVVWTKFSLPPDPTSDIGDLSPETRATIQRFVDKTFGTTDVIWFLNWASLKSIHSVEHFHVLMFNPDQELIKRITNGDVPLKDKVKEQRAD
ncbi:hypothetical protein CBER1_06791 [Cercospora berteroae]|uniref:N-acetylglucosamine-induced protein 1 n=1 Tax=Cercospora berteroae TaxID=357750 RepID=A0A2S6BRB7_9PEZI|nr:hypothetical protein CBER1_06791 [Cercospora berteroae]